MSTNEGGSLERWIVAELERDPHCWVQATPPKLRRTPSGKYAEIAPGPSDFVAVVHGLPVVIEAKSTHKKRWDLGELKPHQAAELDRVTHRGLVGVVVVRFHAVPRTQTYVLPWSCLVARWREWDEGKQRAIKGTASLSPQDVVALGGVDLATTPLVVALERLARADRRAA